MDFLAFFLNGGSCYLCSKEGEVICEKCFSKLEKIEEYEFIHGVKIKSLYKYNQTASKILLLSKYPPYHFYILKFLLKKSGLNLSKDCYLCSVPLSSLKFFERGFNQVDLISNYLAKTFKLKKVNLLKRVRNTKPLYKLGLKERLKETKDAFKPTFESKLIYNKDKYSILLIDDLITTGQTVISCCQTLRKSGFTHIEVFSLFRA